MLYILSGEYWDHYDRLVSLPKQSDLVRIVKRVIIIIVFLFNSHFFLSNFPFSLLKTSLSASLSIYSYIFISLIIDKSFFSRLYLLSLLLLLLWCFAVVFLVVDVILIVIIIACIDSFG